MERNPLRYAGISDRADPLRMLGPRIWAALAPRNHPINSPELGTWDWSKQRLQTHSGLVSRSKTASVVDGAVHVI
jgi:hypothetical protein